MDPKNLVKMIKHFEQMSRIHFVHLRNVKITQKTTFYETAYNSLCGSCDMLKIAKALHDTNFNKYSQPNAAEQNRTKRLILVYDLHNKALGITYVIGFCHLRNIFTIDLL